MSEKQEVTEEKEEIKEVTKEQVAENTEETTEKKATKKTVEKEKKVEKKPTATAKKSPAKKKARKSVGEGTGRRKESVARARLFSGEGKWEINGKTLEEYFPNKVHQQIVNTPLTVVDSVGKYDIIVKVQSGGISGQAGAVRHAVARSLNDADRELFRPSLKKAGLLKRDDRKVERKKPGLKKARKAPQYTKR